jgi:tRNA A37 threonylcarbamoyladenosine dehydratase
MRFSRTELLVGPDGYERLRRAAVAVFGLGGVGSYAVEAVARASVGRLVLVDFDVVTEPDFNRQLLALDETIGRLKVEVARDRVLRINPDAEVEVVRDFVDAGNARALVDRIASGAGAAIHVIDAIDALNSKVHLILALVDKRISFVSCMGASSRRTPTGVQVNDISRTCGCPLARRVRHRLRRSGVTGGVRCVYSEEVLQPRVYPAAPEPEPGNSSADGHGRSRRVNGSLSYVPGIVGLTAAGVILNDILGESGAQPQPPRDEG